MGAVSILLGEALRVATALTGDWSFYIFWTRISLARRVHSMNEFLLSFI